MRLRQIQPYHIGIFAVCAAYLLFQLLCIPTIWLEVDELWFAHHIYQYTSHVPYLDFPPYKTVLGYYLLSLPLYFVHGVLRPLYFIKDEIALINTLIMFGLAWWSARIFQPRAVFYTLVLIISNQLFLIFSTELRVDMLASWLCLVSILLLVRERAAWAGVCIALAFFTSQKALWYIVGTNLTLGFYWLASKNKGENFRAILSFNSAMVAVTLSYVVFWAYFSNLHAVLHSVFYEGYTQAKIQYYAPSSTLYWQIILRHGPLLIMLLPLTLLSLAVKKLSKQRILLLTYGWLSLAVIGTYQQFFAYNTVLLFPVYFVLFAEFFSWLFAGEHQALTISQRGLFWFFSAYLLFLLGFVMYWHLPLAYLLVLLIPLLIWQQKNALSGAALGMMGLTILFTGMFLPLADFGASMHIQEAKYQRATIQLASSLLQDQDYVAGTFIFHDKDQSIAGFENLIQPAQEYAHTGDLKLMPILIPSLNITPKTSPQMLADLQSAPVKLLVNNVRIAALPPAVLNYLRSEYEHYWGGIYFYAPSVGVGQEQVLLKFKGKYRIEARAGIVLDQQQLAPNSVVELVQGMHFSKTNQAYRLRLLPDTGEVALNVAFSHDCPRCFFGEPLVW